MKTFENEELGLRFTVPEHPTVRQQLQWRASTGSGEIDDIYLRLWRGVRKLIGEWECEAVPDPAALNIDEVTNPTVTRIVAWACEQTNLHMTGLEDVPGNS